MSEIEAWYVVQQGDGHCDVMPASEVVISNEPETSTQIERWGPFESQGEAIARRVGLIRSGKCKPA